MFDNFVFPVIFNLKKRSQELIILAQTQRHSSTPIKPEFDFYFQFYDIGVQSKMLDFF